MSGLSLVLFDDAVADDWAPFSLTRPAGELLFGTLTLRARAERVLGVRCDAHLAADHLVGFDEEGAPPVRALGDAPTAGNRLYWLSRAVPAWGASGRLPIGSKMPAPILIGGRAVGWYAPDGAPPPPVSFLRDPSTHVDQNTAAVHVEGCVLEHVWDLVHLNPEQVTADVAALHPDPPPFRPGPGIFHWGGYPVILGEGAHCEPGSVLDTSEGPIWLDKGVVIRSFTRLVGPVYLGPRSTVGGGLLAQVSCGPVCRVHGELAESVCLGYTNKQHDGHIGHAYLGRWVNIGAGTNNSDLKNNYGTVRLWTPGGTRDTGQIKMGCLLGDHVKTAIGLLLNTGTVVGAGSSLHGSATPPKHVPPFSWGSDERAGAFRLEDFLVVAERAMARRGVTLSEEARAQLGRAWQAGRTEAARKGDRSE